MECMFSPKNAFMGAGEENGRAPIRTVKCFHFLPLKKALWQRCHVNVNGKQSYDRHLPIRGCDRSWERGFHFVTPEHYLILPEGGSRVPFKAEQPVQCREHAHRHCCLLMWDVWKQSHILTKNMAELKTPGSCLGLLILPLQSWGSAPFTEEQAVPDTLLGHPTCCVSNPPDSSVGLVWTLPTSSFYLFLLTCRAQW